MNFMILKYGKFIRNRKIYEMILAEMPHILNYVTLIAVSSLLINKQRWKNRNYIYPPSPVGEASSSVQRTFSIPCPFLIKLSNFGSDWLNLF